MKVSQLGSVGKPDLASSGPFSTWLHPAVSTIEQTSPASPSLPGEKTARSRADDGVFRRSLGFLALALTQICSIAWAEPIRLHPENGRYLFWRGEPVVLITSAGHYGAVLNSNFDYGRYLKTLQAEGMMLTRTFSGAYCEPVGAFKITNNTLAPAKDALICAWARSSTPGYANGGNKFDLSKSDPAYFRRLRDFVTRADQHDIVVELVLFCPFYKDDMWLLSPMNVRNNVNGIGSMGREEVYTLKHPDLLAVQDAMVRRIVTELKDCDNLYYEICNEPYFGGVTLAWQAHIAATIVDTERQLGVRPLIAQNIANKTQKIVEPNPAVSIFNFHYAKPPTAVAENYALERVIGDDETGFAGSDDRAYRVEGWNFILAGGGIYNNLDYSFQVGHENGRGAIAAPGGGGVKFRQQMRILREFIHGFDFVHMRPERAFIKGGVPEGGSVYALAQPNRAYALYVSACNGPIHLELELPPGTWQGQWVNTLTGDIDRQTRVITPGQSSAWTSPAFEHDIALRLTRLSQGASIQAQRAVVPKIASPWWQVAGDPDLGDLTSPKQQPVDFGVWQASDGTWQLWSCIRHTKCGGNTRLFYRWEGRALTDSNWEPKGIAMMADPALGESKGGLQAPHVIKVNGLYYMFYGDWQRICLATSRDGKTFTRWQNQRGQPDLFTGPYGQSRDPMVIKIKGLYHLYYCGHVGRDEQVRHKGAMFCRTSHDLFLWSEPMLVSAGGSPTQWTNWYAGDVECPFVVELDGLYYLFRNQLYGQNNLNTQYCSPNPLSFGVDDDRYMIGTLPVAAPEIIQQGQQYYIAALMPTLKGIRVAELKWVPRE